MDDVNIKKKVEPIYLQTLKQEGKLTTYLRVTEVCEHCPLGARKEKRVVDGREVEITLPAQCKLYQPFRKKCVFPIPEQLQRIKTFAEIENQEGTVNLQKALIMQSVMDTELARKAEMVVHGQPKFYTKEFAEQSLKYTNELNKMQFSDKQSHQHIHFGEDIAEKMVASIFNNNLEKKNGSGNELSEKDNTTN